MKPALPARVLVIGPIPPPIHGAALVTRKVIELATEAGGDPVVCNTASAHPSGVRYHLARLRSHLRACGVIFRYRTRLSTVYLAAAGGLGLYYQCLAAMTARLCRAPLVIHHHSYAYVTRRSPAMRLLTLIAGDGAEHVALSQDMTDDLRRLYHSIGAISVCSNSAVVDLPSGSPGIARTADDQSDVTFTVGHLSNLSVEKGLELVIRTFEAFHQTHPKSKLLLAGPTDSSQARTLIEEVAARLGRYVSYQGALNRKQVGDFMTSIDVFLFPSLYRHEAEPLVVLEANSYGSPAILTDFGCAQEMQATLGLVVGGAETFTEKAVPILARLAEPGELNRARAEIRSHFQSRRDSSIDTLVRIAAGRPPSSVAIRNAPVASGEME